MGQTTPPAKPSTPNGKARRMELYLQFVSVLSLLFYPLYEAPWVREVLFLERCYLFLILYASRLRPRQFTAHKVAEYEYQ
jgi:hypothetical protein